MVMIRNDFHPAQLSLSSSDLSTAVCGCGPWDVIEQGSGYSCKWNCLTLSTELKLLACNIPSEIFFQWATFSVHLCLFFRILRSRMRANRRLWESIIRNRGLCWTKSASCNSSSVRYVVYLYIGSICSFWPHSVPIKETPENSDQTKCE